MGFFHDPDTTPEFNALFSAPFTQRALTGKEGANREYLGLWAILG